MQKQTTMLGCPARQHVLQDIKLLADEFIFTSLQRWKQVPAHTREYIRQELADNGIDIEQVLATVGTLSNHICAPEEKFLSIREAARLAKCSRTGQMQPGNNRTSHQRQEPHCREALPVQAGGRQNYRRFL